MTALLNQLFNAGLTRRQLKRTFLPTLCLLTLVQFSLPTQPLAAETDTTDNTTETEVVDIVYPDWFKTSFMELEEDIIEAQESGKRLMLVFHQPGCPYCNALVEQNLSQKDIEETVKNNFDVIEINMWGDLEVVNVDGEEFTEKTFAEYLEVQFTPTVLMYHSNGSIAMRMNGYFPPDKFRVALDYVMNENTDEISFTDYLASVNPDALNTTKSGDQTPALRDYIAADSFNTDEIITLPDTNSGTPYILLFEQRDCSNCDHLHDTVFTDTETLALLKQFHVVRLDMWGQDPIRLTDGSEISGRELAKTMEINYAPTMVVHSQEHNEVIRSESWLNSFHTETMLEYILTDSWKEQPSFQRFLRERADNIRESGGTVQILD